MYDIFVKLFNVLDGRWQSKIIGATSDGAASMTGRYEGTITYIQKACNPGFIRVWCGLHQLDIVVQKAVTNFFDEDFYSTLTGIIGYLRRQLNLIAKMKLTCPKVADTRWLSLGRVSRWLLKKYIPISDYLEEKKPACAPPSQWWIFLSVVNVVMVDHVDIIFRNVQSLTTLASQQ